MLCCYSVANQFLGQSNNDVLFWLQTRSLGTAGLSQVIIFSIKHGSECYHAVKFQDLHFNNF